MLKRRGTASCGTTGDAGVVEPAGAAPSPSQLLSLLACGPATATSLRPSFPFARPRMIFDQQPSIAHGRARQAAHQGHILCAEGVRGHRFESLAWSNPCTVGAVWEGAGSWLPRLPRAVASGDGRLHLPVRPWRRVPEAHGVAEVLSHHGVRPEVPPVPEGHARPVTGKFFYSQPPI